MKRRLPLVFRVSAILLLTALIAGQWWQRQPAGTIAGWVPAMAEVHCPAAAIHRSGTIVDSARTLDDWGYAVIGNAIFRDGRDRCRVRKGRSGGAERSPGEK
ncbi:MULTISPECIES: hypothetical protein [Sphingomonas]|uniref:Uncharacterized protein n=2 Tax=Sphingomonas paucimobilis TaxID=13689 RepID=A0A411LEQ9_SPHPI|nr:MULTISPECIES: hypothetical protein [Sphingomonas]MBQ1480433.1 hypothetical protein [Sphingomonas sp.]MCM3680880.1 hypothetical protein [Sphingomonas paucimobilis]MDG5971411.1 hypothetical protein [Sphingomonas paucimobilis]NNG58714.1 hypothetical protein [Sphingomonas paucimobilis]QBE90779.1 hypothetical protein DRN02_000980 [Sphingomonas paucimobilis]